MNYLTNHALLINLRGTFKHLMPTQTILEKLLSELLGTFQMIVIINVFILEFLYCLFESIQ